MGYIQGTVPTFRPLSSIESTRALLMLIGVLSSLPRFVSSMLRFRQTQYATTRVRVSFRVRLRIGVSISVHVTFSLRYGARVVIMIRGYLSCWSCS